MYELSSRIKKNNNIVACASSAYTNLTTRRKFAEWTLVSYMRYKTLHNYSTVNIQTFKKDLLQIGKIMNVAISQSQY